MNYKKLQSQIAIAIVSAALASFITWLSFSVKGVGGIKDSNSSFETIAECKKIIDENGLSEFDKDGALDGYLKGGYDQYTFIKKKVGSDLIAEMTKNVNSSGTAKASGFQIDCTSDGEIIMFDVAEGKAAYLSGLRENDIIVSINGESVSEAGYENIANKLLGKNDTEVSLVVRRNGVESEINFKRDNEYIKDVDCTKYGDIGYIRIKSYGEFAVGYLNQSVDDLGNLKGYIIDLRGNLGGDTESCVDMLDVLAPGIEVKLEYKNGDETVFTSKTGSKAIIKPIVVLLDNNTASSSEIVASAIKQSNAESILLGTCSYGKGVFQAPYKLKSGDVLYYTAGYFTVGDWDCWQDKGIEPDVEVEMDPSLIGTDGDIQLKKALELLG